MVFLLAYHVVFTGYAWGVWGLLACSLLSPPPISFSSTLTLTLALPIVIVVGSLVDSPVGLGEFEVNSGCFSLLLVGTYWWLVYLLPFPWPTSSFSHLSSNLVTQLCILPRTYGSHIPLTPPKVWSVCDLFHTCHCPDLRYKSSQCNATTSHQ
jgi:hypothetical protein